MRPRLQLFALVTALGLKSVAALASEEEAGRPFMREMELSGVYNLEGGFEVDAGPGAVWQVLTDYPDLPRFVPSVRSSVAHVLADGGLVVDQEFEGKAFIFTRDMRVQLTVRQQPEESITFHDLALKDFEVYEGSWRIQPTALGSKVAYFLKAKPREAVPDFIARGAFSGSALEMLRRLRDEIIRSAGRTRVAHLTQQQSPEGRSP